MKLSVIIPTYNEQKVIRECLESLDHQKHNDFEVIVVDDGSSDETARVVKEYKPNKYPLIFISQKHEGPAVARNKGAKEARGQILVFVDADMTFEKVFLSKLVAPIVAGKAIGTWSSDEVVSNWNNVWSRCWNYNEGWQDKKRQPKKFTNEHEVFRAIKRAEFLQVGGFTKGGYTDDSSLSEKLNSKAVNVVGARFYHKNPESLSEVYLHARWVGKRRYKFGVLGVIVGLVRSSFPISILVGAFKALAKKTPRFIIFKVIYDFGIFLGIIEYYFKNKGAK